MTSLATPADLNLSAHAAHSTSKAELIAGRVITGLVGAFLLFDSVGKLLKLAPVIEGTAKLGYPEHVIVGLGVVLLISTLAYLVPATSLLGAILLTGYLGGAVATHVRVDAPLFSHVLFPVYMGVLLWAGLCLRDARLRELLLLRRHSRG
jgi:hypothetical protein